MFNQWVIPVLMVQSGYYKIKFKDNERIRVLLINYKIMKCMTCVTPNRTRLLIGEMKKWDKNAGQHSGRIEQIIHEWRRSIVSMNKC